MSALCMMIDTLNSLSKTNSEREGVVLLNVQSKQELIKKAKEDFDAKVDAFAQKLKEIEKKIKELREEQNRKSSLCLGFGIALLVIGTILSCIPNPITIGGGAALIAIGMGLIEISELIKSKYEGEISDEQNSISVQAGEKDVAEANVSRLQGQLEVLMKNVLRTLQIHQESMNQMITNIIESLRI